MLVIRTEAKGMDVGADSEAEGSECRGDRYVQGCTYRCCAKLKALITNVGKVRHSADGPGRQPPHLRMISWESEGDADESVSSANYDRGEEPRLPGWFGHCRRCGLNADVRA